jgi:hypothetical protein
MHRLETFSQRDRSNHNRSQFRRQFEDSINCFRTGETEV